MEQIVKIKVTETEREVLKLMLKFHLEKENPNPKLIPIAKEILLKLEQSKTFFEALEEDLDKEREFEKNKNKNLSKHFLPSATISGKEIKSYKISSNHHLEEFKDHLKLISFRLGADEGLYPGDIVEISHSSLPGIKKLYFVEQFHSDNFYQYGEDERMMEELKDITAKINKYTIVSYYWFHPYENKENINNAINYLKNIPNGG